MKNLYGTTFIVGIVAALVSSASWHFEPEALSYLPYISTLLCVVGVRFSYELYAPKWSWVRGDKISWFVLMGLLLAIVCLLMHHWLMEEDYETVMFWLARLSLITGLGLAARSGYTLYLSDKQNQGSNDDK